MVVVDDDVVAVAKVGGGLREKGKKAIHPPPLSRIKDLRWGRREE